MELARDFYVGVVEDNKDPNRKGRIKVKIQTLYHGLSTEDLPYAYPLGSLAGKEFQVPAIGKLVNVLFFSDDLYSPYYIYSENYNINLQNKLQNLSDDEYINFTALLLDDKTQIFSDNTELTLDYYFNKMTVSKSAINLELKDNKQKLNLGSKSADQDAVLGTRFFEWMDQFIDELEKPYSLVDSNGASVMKPAIQNLCSDYHSLRPDFLSKNVKLVDNRNVDTLSRDTSPYQHDTDLIIPEADISPELRNLIDLQSTNACGGISNALPTGGVGSIPDESDIPAVSDKHAVFTVKRYKFLTDRTIGKLYVNDTFFCDTLEDVVRDLNKEKKVFGQTAIPYGIYPLTIGATSLPKNVAPTGRLPLVNNVQFFDGIRIHVGNKPEHTKGCLLVGNLDTNSNTLKNSSATSARVTQLCEKYNSSKIKMTIVYTIDDNTNQDTTSTKNSFNGANYTDKNDGNPTLDGNSDCTVGTPDSSWTSNLEMSDTKINGEEVKFDGNYIVTEAQLKKIMSQASNSNIKKFIIPLNVAMKKFGITAPLQVSAFLSQIALESGNLLYTKELGGPSYFKRYDGRKDLGNTKLGDGAKYCGRGLIQVTGKSNYADLSKNLGADFVTSPEMLESPTWASISAAYWWFKNQNKKTKKMRANLAGCIATKDIQGITYAVNGGQNGISERTKYYKNALSILGLA